MIEAYFDGACEPINPGGTASYGAVILKDGKRIWATSRIFEPEEGRVTSNNVAEYCGLVAILEQLMKFHYEQEEIRICGDSRLVINQMNRRWKIKNGHYVPLAKMALKYAVKFPKISFHWIPREENSLADELSKAELKKKGIKFRLQREE